MTNTSIAGQPDTDPGPVPAAEVEQEWIFTFGHGQRAYAHRAGPEIGPARGHGMSLLDRYVVIRGTAESSRARMFHVFGDAWSHQYATRDDAGVSEWELTELVLTVDTGVTW